MALFNWFENPGSDPYQQGIAAFDNRDYPAAIQAFGECLKLNKDPNVQRLARFYLGESIAHLSHDALKGGDPKQAIEWFTAAVEQFPGYADLRFVLAYLFAKSEQFERALLELGHALAIDASYARALYLKGWILIRTGDRANGLSILHEACGIETAFCGPALTEAFAAAEAGDWNDAIELFERVLLETDPPSLHAIQAANRFFKLQKYDAAAYEFEKALAANPGFADLWCRLGECRLRLGQFREAEEALNCAVALNDRYEDALFHLAEAQLALDKPDAARLTIADLSAANPNYPGIADLLSKTAA
jgi:tetratricopeptide (TPR) repeat protein